MTESPPTILIAFSSALELEALSLSERVRREQTARVELIPLGGLENSPGHLNGLLNLTSSANVVVALISSVDVVRSTVAFHLGMLFGRVGGDRLILVRIGSVGPPNDIRALRWISVDRFDEIAQGRTAEAVAKALSVPAFSGVRGSVPRSCFISYSHHDRAFAEKLAVDLADAGFAPWTDMQISAGQRWADEIRRAIAASDTMLIVLSQRSIGSASIHEEIRYALDVASERSMDAVYPIRLDDAAFRATSGPVRDLVAAVQVVDFENWQEPEPYRRSLKRLVKDLVVGEAAGGSR